VLEAGHDLHHFDGVVVEHLSFKRHQQANEEQQQQQPAVAVVVPLAYRASW